MQVQLATGQMVHVPVPQGYGPGMMVRAPYIIIIISVLFIALTCNLPSGVIKSNSQILLPRRGGTIKSLQLLSTSGTLLGLEQLGSRSEPPTNPHDCVSKGMPVCTASL